MGATEIKTYFTPDDIAAASNQRIQEISQDFIQKINAVDYPCVGAKSAIHTNQYRVGIYEKMGAEESTRALNNDLKTYIEETVAADSQYMSMIAVFTDQIQSELDFEEKLWLQLQKLHDSEKDEHPWDPTVGSNPDERDFSFSFHGKAFFVVGIHPHASRKSRRFRYPAMAFNLHSQFERLRDLDLYEKMKSTIRDREINYDGDINPMLSDHGEGLEAPQYSGRKVDKSWKCPFHAK
ncbi:guanitoxin biosynthesis heme-dependent pre-guanitoxin N-hydroxylase GntA [Sphingobacterium gobiense]|uniref:YqcI/YcgG family protein n=1 Tax=Sphingobacterium gobiense TaxID=1382456 RepID=A0A2S9JV66_9SPHI|nr:guanitoxin biosynthesis heme-dependent pre-guanitoxin N-hydroxylase GntA [Sphingobacterium gobiense]PRD57172.1 YqcI/YcgG family protein [Sphingobacterium gobiense]